MATDPAGPQNRSSRDREALRPALEQWLASKLPSASDPAVGPIERSSATGMSSDTVLFEATWTEDGAARTERLVARLAPDPADVPVFPAYHLDRQFEVIRLVAELTTVPVPPVRWLEPDPSPLGVPFFVMGRVDGQVPPDLMPYPFGDNWLHDAAPDDQRRLQDSTIDVLIDLHAVADPEERFSFLGFDEGGATPLQRHLAHTRAWYEFVVDGQRRSPLLDRCMAWLDAAAPAAEGPAVLCWGDSRIGNVLYRDFTPAAVLDWEMAALGPAELDLAWLLYAHRVFDDLAAALGLPGMPGFLTPEAIVSRYEAGSGRQLRDLAFFATYSAIQWGIVFLRTAQREIHFGAKEMPADIDDLLHNREPLERMLAGSYWSL